MDFELSKFEQYREDNRREVKTASFAVPASMWQTYSSFANSYGGVIILGVEEKKNGAWAVTGVIDKEHLIKNIWDTVNNKGKISVNLLTEKDIAVYQKDDNSIIVIHVPQASREQKPVYINNDLFNGTYRRNGEGDYHCSRSEVLAMLRDAPDEGQDTKILEDYSVKELDAETIQKYRNNHRAYRPGHPWNGLDDEEYLEKIGAAAISRKDGLIHPTAAGLLMFGEEYKIVREFPEYFLDYREMLDPAVRWTDRLTSSSGEWTGNLFEFFFRVYNKLSLSIKIPFKLEGANRIDDTPVHKAVREALANCLVNSDYNIGRGVVIKRTVDAIVMENPGHIRVGKHQMLKGGVSDPRNKNLMKMFTLIGIGEKAGSGVPDILFVWKQEGFEDPVVIEELDVSRTILELSLEKKQAEKTSGKKQAETSKISRKTMVHIASIKTCLSEKDAVTISDISRYIGLSEARTRAILKVMVDSGDVVVQGTTKGRRYSTKLDRMLCEPRHQE